MDAQLFDKMMKRRNETTDLEESQLLETKRATSKKCLSVCNLQRDLCSLILTIQKGGHWQLHGHTHSGKTYLDIEEALFLAECSVLEIRVDGLPVSIQQAYHTLLSSANGLSLALYQVYATLKRCGYIVLRRRLIGLSDKAWPVCTLCRRQSNTSLEEDCSAGPTDPFPTPSALLIAGQLAGDILAALHQTNSISFYKLTMTSIPAVN